MIQCKIDAHHHLWKYNDREYPWMSERMGALRRDFLLPDLERTLSGSDITATIAVQARQSLAETCWLLDLARKSDLIRGVVGWVPLVDAEVTKYLDELTADRNLKAVRHVLHDERDDGYVLRDDFNRGVALLESHGLVYDILIFERHLPQTLRFVNNHPNQTFVLDHIGKPRIRDHVVSPWREYIRELAKREQVYCKVSGMVTEASWENWSCRDLEPYLDIVLEAFGPKRIMFGSDWPVLNVATDYITWSATVHDYFATLSDDEQASIWAGTAKEAYRL